MYKINKMKKIFLIILVSVLIISISTSSCSNPPPDVNYSIKAYEGRWY